MTSRKGGRDEPLTIRFAPLEGDDETNSYDSDETVNEIIAHNLVWAGLCATTPRK